MPTDASPINDTWNYEGEPSRYQFCVAGNINLAQDQGKYRTGTKEPRTLRPGCTVFVPGLLAALCNVSPQLATCSPAPHFKTTWDITFHAL